MKSELKKSVDKILKSPLSKVEKTISLIALAELSFKKGDVLSYNSLVDEVKKINPELVKSFKSDPITLENLAKTSFPII